MMAATLGLPAYRFALADHPIGSPTLEEVRARARPAYEHVRSIPLGAGPQER